LNFVISVVFVLRRCLISPHTHLTFPPSHFSHISTPRTRTARLTFLFHPPISSASHTFTTTHLFTQISPRAHQRLQEVRRDLVAQPPAITRNPNCFTDDHVVCHGWWQDDWRRYVSEPVFRTINPMPISQAYEAMKAITFHTSVCRKDAMEALMANEFS
ncbi:hypothetical protein BJ165DRAFT_1468904, partial [Panaeolus papilionaceus]